MRSVAAFVSAVVAFACLSSASAASNDSKAAQPVYSPWTKWCLPPTEGKRTCFIARDLRSDCGLVGGIVLIATDNESRATLRVTLPPDVARGEGARIAIDGGEPIVRPFAACLANGCLADYETDAGLVERLKHGRSILISGTNSAGQPINAEFSLSGFSEAYEGPSFKPHVYERDVSRKEFEELLKRSQEPSSSANRCEANPG